MKLHFECNMGASGNMVMAALYELLPDKTAFIKKMKKLDLPGVTIKCTESTKCGITGTYISVLIEGVEEISEDVKVKHNHSYNHYHEHEHEFKRQREHSIDPGHSHHHDHSRRYGYKEILGLIQKLDLPGKVKVDATSVYKIIGEAESHVHGTSLDETHFHEVGSIDAVVDVVGCSLLMDMLGIKEVSASPVHVGFGMVRCEHGILPVPAPATAEILKNIPMYGGSIEGELCTPTGAALLKHFVTDFGKMPPMIVKKIGHGMGKKDFEEANCLRAFLYESTADTENQDYICEISCNLDDMTPEAIGAAFDVLLNNGALDVYTVPIMMKKNRPAVMLTCLCTEESHDTFVKLIIKHTSTLGVRTTMHYRTIMQRTNKTVQTEYGSIRLKQAQGLGITKMKPEYDDVMAASIANNVSFRTVYDAAIFNSQN